MEIFLVIKQSISGWSMEVIKAFENSKDAEIFILKEKRMVQYEFKIEKITLVRTNHPKSLRVF